MDPQTRSVYGIDTNALTFFREELKPKCSELATLLQQVTYPLSESTTAKLKTSLTNITQFITDCNHDIDMFLDYITFPLLLILEKDFIYRKKKATSNGMPSLVLEKTLDALSACFRKLKSMEQGEKFIALFQSLFIIHIVYADDDHSTSEVFVNTSSIASSEELKLSLIHAFRDFVNCQWTYSHSSKLFTLQSISIFASKLLDVAVKEKNRLLVETSLRAIGDLLTLCRKTKGHLPDDNFKHIIESIFPGLISQVSKLIISPPFISRAVQCAAFDLFGTVTCMNCSDALNGFIPEVQTTESENNSESSLTIEKLSQMIFTSDDKKKQVKAKFEKFEPFLRKIFSTEIYAQYSSTVTFDQVTEIQQCMLENCANILTECSHALYDSVDVLVECLLVGGRDNIETMEYSDSIESRFLTLVKSIPSTCKTTNEKEKTVTFKLFHSYLEYILKSQKGSNFIASDEMVSEMTLSLMLSLQMDHYNPITEDNQFPKKIFVNFVDDRMIQVIYSICHLLGRKLSLLSKPYIEHLLSIAFSIRGKSSESSYRNESILVLIQILEGLLQDKSCSHNTIQDFSKTIIHTIIDTMSEKLIETSSDSIETNCLILECMSTVAKFVDPNRHDERDMLLLKILYPILNQLGYPSIHIRQSCFKTISEISKHFYPNKEISSSPRDCVMYLLVTNFDYMIDDIRYRLKYLSLYPHIPQVLNTLFEYNVIGKKFTESISYSELTNHKREEFSAHLNMVSIVDDCIQSVFNAIDQQQQFTDSKRTTLPTLFSILGNIIKTLHVLKQERESLDLSEKKELTEKEITTIKAILSKLQHFMNSSQNSLLNSVSFLTIIENAVAMFEHSNIREEDEHSTGNKILSSIHLLWPMLMTHLLQKRTSITLKQRTLELIQLLGTKFHDFLGSRILSELIPYLNRILKDYHHSQVELKYKKEPMRMDYYKTEPEYKYLRAILCFLIQMLQTTTMKENIEHSSWKELQLQVIEKLKYAKDESVPEEIRSLASQLNDRLTHVAEHTESNAEF